MKTPGVYIKHVSVLPKSVVEVATAVPAFVGYTSKARDGRRSLTGKPHRISSISEYEQYFGVAPSLEEAFTLTNAPPRELDEGRTEPTYAGPSDPVLVSGRQRYYLASVAGKPHYRLFQALRWFFQNGGGPCWIVSVGGYTDTPGADALKLGINALVKEREPTMVVVPEAVYLTGNGCADVQNAAIAHCASTMSRVAILDVYRGFQEKRYCIDYFRANVQGRLDYAAAYYPWVETSVLSSRDPALTFKTFDVAAIEVIGNVIAEELGGEAQAKKLVADKLAAENTAADPDSVRRAHDSLSAMSTKYKDLMNALLKEINRLPPSSAMAGVYARIDTDRGVWKAPANVAVVGAVAPCVNISDREQETLNVDAVGGKSVNAIRTFVGQGTIVWGARTLAGHSPEWRYVSVRRTVIMLEQSMKLATEAYVFEPNTAQTWSTIKGMIGDFLTSVWRRGGLAGATADEAFGVKVGLGETMTAEDVRGGILRVTVLVAPMRPAEFIPITFQQKMQKS